MDGSGEATESLTTSPIKTNENRVVLLLSLIHIAILA